MSSLEPLDDDMFDEIYSAFLYEATSLAKEDWHPLFLRSYALSDAPLGFALVDGGKVVGVIGTLQSSRSLRNRTVNFCNLHCWFVKDSARAHSLRLIQPVLRLKDVTFTDFTPSKFVRKLFCERLGFQQLNSDLRFLIPSPSLSRSDRKSAAAILVDPNEIDSYLSTTERKFLNDHSPPKYGHAYIKHSEGNCFVIYAVITRHVFRFCHIYLISDKEIFGKTSIALRKKILEKENARYIVIDERTLAGTRLPLSFRLPLGMPQMYRSNEARPQDIDALYSEYSILCQPPFLSIREKLRTGVREVSQFFRRS